MSVWGPIYKAAWGALIILILAALVGVFLPQYQQYRDYSRREAALQDELRLERELIRTLRHKQEQFRTNPEFVQRIAHEIGLAREGETLYKFHESPSGSPPAAAP